MFQHFNLFPAPDGAAEPYWRRSAETASPRSEAGDIAMHYLVACASPTRSASSRASCRADSSSAVAIACSLVHGAEHAVRRADFGARPRDGQESARYHDHAGAGRHDHAVRDARNGFRAPGRRPRRSWTLARLSRSTRRTRSSPIRSTTAFGRLPAADRALSAWPDMRPRGDGTWGCWHNPPQSGSKGRGYVPSPGASRCCPRGVSCCARWPHLLSGQRAGVISRRRRASLARGRQLARCHTQHRADHRRHRTIHHAATVAGKIFFALYGMLIGLLFVATA